MPQNVTKKQTGGAVVKDDEYYAYKAAKYEYKLAKAGYTLDAQGNPVPLKK